MNRMFRIQCLAVLFLVLVLAQPVPADDNAKVAGLWKLVSYVVEVQTTGEIMNVMGNHPTGYVLFMPEGRAFFILTAEGRKPAKTDKEKAELLSTIVSYTGMYRVEGDQWITKIEVAWNPEWIGTEQRRPFKIEGNRLKVLTPWRMMPNWADKGMTRSIITFERAEK
jgi:hypothetical protein